MQSTRTKIVKYIECNFIIVATIAQWSGPIANSVLSLSAQGRVKQNWKTFLPFWAPEPGYQNLSADFEGTMS